MKFKINNVKMNINIAVLGNLKNIYFFEFSLFLILSSNILSSLLLVK